jgi:hypothetical protein
LKALVLPLLTSGVMSPGVTVTYSLGCALISVTLGLSTKRRIG